MQSARRALQADGSHFKSFLRAAAAAARLREWTLVRQLCAAGLALEPDNPDLLRLDKVPPPPPVCYHTSRNCFCVTVITSIVFYPGRFYWPYAMRAVGCLCASASHRSRSRAAAATVPISYQCHSSQAVPTPHDPPRDGYAAMHPASRPLQPAPLPPSHSAVFRRRSMRRRSGASAKSHSAQHSTSASGRSAPSRAASRPAASR